MKKFLFLLCAAVLCAGSAMAQTEKGDITAGVQLSYGSEVGTLGLGARIMYNPIHNLRAEFGTNYFFKREHRSMWDINLNAHYLIGIYREQVYLYPIAGFCFASESFDEKDDHYDISKFGLNLGAGAEYMINEHVGITLEYRHTIMKTIDQGVGSVGLNYKF